MKKAVIIDALTIFRKLIINNKDGLLQPFYYNKCGVAIAHPLVWRKDIIEALDDLMLNLKLDCRNNVADLHWYDKKLLVVAPSNYNFIRFAKGKEDEIK